MAVLLEVVFRIQDLGFSVFIIATGSFAALQKGGV